MASLLRLLPSIQEHFPGFPTQYTPSATIELHLAFVLFVLMLVVEAPFAKACESQNRRNNSGE